MRTIFALIISSLIAGTLTSAPMPLKLSAGKHYVVDASDQPFFVQGSSLWFPHMKLNGTDITLVGSDQSFRTLTRFGIDQSDGVTAVSEFLRRKTVEVFRPQRAIQVIPNFVDTSRYAPRDPGKSRRERFAKKGEKILVHISNFRPGHRLSTRA